MRFIDAAAVDAALSYPALVDVLEQAFRTGAIAPVRHHHPIRLADPDGTARPDAMLLLMPAWSAAATGSEIAGRYLGIKCVTVFPDNARRTLPAIDGAYLLNSAETGAPLAIIDAPRLTVWRTAAASALAARHLARSDARRMLMVGAGALSPFLVRAHASVRPIREVAIWNRRPDGAAKVAAALAGSGLAVSVVDDLEAAARTADVISTATLSSEPLIRGAWLKPGAHLDCVGAYRPDMRESDDECVARARVYVDTRAGALKEAGDIVLAIRAGVLTPDGIAGDLADLARGTAQGRVDPQEITMFKSVGAAIEDLAAAIAIYERP